MNGPSSVRREHDAARTATACAMAIIAIAGAVLLGWTFEFRPLASIVPGKSTMKPLTAVAFLLYGFGLALHAAQLRDGRRGVLARLCCAATGVIGLGTLLEYGLGLHTGLDRWLFASRFAEQRELFPGRMAVLSAVMLTLLAAAGTSAGRRGVWSRVAELLSLAAMVLGLVVAAGYLYEVQRLYSFAPFAAVSLPTAVLTIAAAAGTLALMPDGVLLAPLLSPRGGGAMSRRLLPAVVLVPLSVGWARLAGQRAGLYDTAAGVALFACSNALVFALITWWMARQVNDIDQRRDEAAAAARASVDASERRYRTLAESLPQLVWTCTPDGQCDYLSPQWLAYTGLSEAAQLEAGWTAQVHADDVDSLTQHWQAAFAAGTPFESEFRIRRADGVFRWFKTRALPVRDRDGRIDKWFGCNTDIDDHRNAEQTLRTLADGLDRRVRERTRELEAAKELAESADRLKTEFIMSMSHELRTPLNAVIGFTGTLLMRLPGPLTVEQERQLRLVQTGGKHLLAIISDVLDVARIDAGTLTLTPEIVDAQQIVAAVVSELQPLAAEKALALVVAPLRGTPAVLADRRALKQVLLNVIGNALKFTDRGGVTVTIAAEPGDRVAIAVADTGIGIGRDDITRLFRKFVRVDARGGGTGLGLYLSRMLLERLDGSIGVESAPGEGSLFTVRLRSASQS